MRMLSQKVAVLATVCILSVLLFAGCDSGLQISDEVISLEINGWTLSSPEGEAAIRDKTASEVTAQKVMENGSNLYNCTITGNAESVLDRANDPLFGFGEVDYNDQVVQNYLDSFNMKSITNVKEMHVDIHVSMVEGPVNSSRYIYPTYMTLTPSMDPFHFGVACSKIYCNVTPISSNMRFALYYKFCAVGGQNWFWGSTDTSPGEIFTAMGQTRVNSKGVFGWWQWKMFFSIYSGGDASFGFNWYGAINL